MHLLHILPFHRWSAIVHMYSMYAGFVMDSTLGQAGQMFPESRVGER